MRFELTIFGQPEFDGYESFTCYFKTMEQALNYLKDYPDSHFLIETVYKNKTARQWYPSWRDG